MILAVIFVCITPFLLIPIWVVPNPYSDLIRNMLGICLILSIALLALAGILGNVYWYFDPSKGKVIGPDGRRAGKWRWYLHCGKGPTDHFWGDTLFSSLSSSSSSSSVSLTSPLSAYDVKVKKQSQQLQQQQPSPLVNNFVSVHRMMV